MKLLRSSILVLAYLCFNSCEVKAQWQSSGLTNTTVNAFAVSGTNLFAATSDGVYLSTNKGASWTKVNSGLDSAGIPYTTPALAVSGSNLFAGTNHGVYLSTNSGTSWTRVSTGLTDGSVNSLAVSPNGAGGSNLFAGTSGSVFVSTNNGSTWTNTTFPYWSSYVRALAVNGSTVFAGTDSGRVFRSSDNGSSWTLVNVGGGWNKILSLAAVGSNIFAGTYGNGILHSTDGGARWDQKFTSYTNSLVYAILVVGSNAYAGTNGGIFASADNGTNWTQVNSGLTTTSVQSLVLSGSTIFAGTSNGDFQRSLGDFMTIVAPQPAATGVKNPLKFIWNRNNQALTYALQVSKDVAFSNPVINQFSTDTSYIVSSLDPATTYYWRVRAENASSASEWALSSFTTTLFNSVPTLVSPVNGATWVSVTPTVQWNPLASAATYTVQISTQSNFTALVSSRDTTGTGVLLPALQHSATYFWRVRAQTIGDTTAWSSVSTFTTIPPAPGKITLVYPDSAKQDALQYDWFLWQKESSATSYHIDISPSPLFTTVFDSGTVSGDSYRNPTKLFSVGSTYFWRVKGLNVAGDGQFSSVWSFKAGSSQRAPELQLQSSVIQFGKTKVGESAEVGLAVSNPGNDTLKVSRIDVIGDGLTVDPKSFVILPGSSSNLRIRYAPVAGGALAGTISLASNAGSSPGVINVSGFGAICRILLTPVWIDMGFVHVGDTKNAMFSLVNKGNDTLRVSEISTSISIPGLSLQRGSMVILPADSSRCDIHFAPTIIGAAKGIVLVVSNASTSPDSVVLIVSGISAATGVLPDHGIPTTYSLGQNYPNPFNPSTMIIYAVPQSANVSLRIFNTLGQEVLQLVNEQKSPGYYQVEWNANVPSGIYFYRLQAGEFVETKKMILLK